MMPELDLNGIGVNQKLLIAEIKNRGVKCQRFENTNIFCFEREGGRKIYMVDTFTNLVPLSCGQLISNKNFMKQLLINRRIGVSWGKVFFAENEAVKFGKKTGFPVFLRQENSLGAEKARMAKNAKDLVKAFLGLRKTGAGVLVEKYFKGDTYRVFYSGSGFINILKRNWHYSVYDSGRYIEAMDTYSEAGFLVGKEMVLLAKRVLNCFPRMGCVTFEIMVKNIQKPLKKGNYVVSEIYHWPGDNIRYDAFKGKKRMKAVSLVADLILKNDAYDR